MDIFLSDLRFYENEGSKYLRKKRSTRSKIILEPRSSIGTKTNMKMSKGGLLVQTFLTTFKYGSAPPVQEFASLVGFSKLFTHMAIKSLVLLLAGEITYIIFPCSMLLYVVASQSEELGHNMIH